MKKKFILLAMMLLTLIGGVKFNVLNAQQQETIEIGTTGTTKAQWLPVYVTHYNSVSQQIYTQSEINHESGQITEITFFQKPDSYGVLSSYQRNVVVYMSNTDKSSFNSDLSTWENFTESAPVYSGILQTGQSEVTIQLNSPFEYDGGNLLVCVFDNTDDAGAYGAAYFATYSSGGDRSIYRSDMWGYNGNYTVESILTMTPNVKTENNQIRLTFEAAGDDVIPAAPTNLVATAIDHKSIFLTWTAGDEYALNYQVWQGENMIAETDQTEYLVDEGLSDGTEYCFTVKSVRYNNNTSDASEESCATTAVLPVPGTPVNLAATNITHNSVTLTWDDVEYAESYTVSYTDGTMTVTENTCDVTGLTPETNYTFSVTANNIKGSSSAAEVSAITLEYNDPFAGKLFRIKVNSGNANGQYLNIFSYNKNSATNMSSVGVKAKADTEYQKFIIESAGNGNYYLKNTAGYYIKCAEYNVDAFSTTEKTALTFEYVSGSDGPFYLRDSEYTGGKTDNYFKAEYAYGGDFAYNYHVYCNQPITNTYVVKWTLEEVVLSATATTEPNSIYDDQTTTLSVTAMDGSGNYTYSWSPAEGLSDATSANPTFSPATTGEHTFTCTVTDTESGSTAEASVTVYVYPRPALYFTVSADKDFIYNDGETAVLTATVTEGTGYAPYTYSWTLNETEDGTEATYVFSSETVGVYNLTCTVTDARNNIQTASTTIEVKDESEKPLEIVLGTDNTGNAASADGYIPTNTFYYYSLTQQIYTKNEIGMDGNIIINSIAFKESAGQTTTRNLSIYIQNTSETAVNSLYSMNKNDLRFAGNVEFRPYEWTVVTLDTPFEYDASKNILLCVDDNTGSYVSGRSFATYYNGEGGSYYAYSDNTNFDPMDPSNGNGSSGSKNHIKLGYEIPAPKPENLVATPAQIHVGETTTLTWNELEGAARYNIYVNGELKYNTAETSYELSGLTYNVEPGHTIEVAAVYEDETESGKASVTVQVAGTFTLTVNVTDGTNPIKGATVNIDMAYAYDEFKNQISPVTVEPTGADGKTTVELLRLPNEGFYNDNGNWVYPFYTVEVLKSPYQKQEKYINPGDVVTNGHTMDFVLALPTVSNIKVQDPAGNDLHGDVMEGTDLILSWDAVEGADSYKVYTFVEDVEIKSETTIDPKYFVEGVEKGYRYAVSALFGDLESEKYYANLTVKGNGYFKGYVTDDGTNALEGIQVKVSSEYGDASAVVTTDEEGYFSGQIMEGENYKLTISHSDYEEYILENITIIYNNASDLGTIQLTAKPSASGITEVTATLNGENVVVNWTVDEAYTKYNVYRRLAGTQGKGDNIATELTTTSTTDAAWETLEPGTYEYGVSAFVEPQAQTKGTEVIFEEGFENGLPTGWTRDKYSQSGGTIYDWYVTTGYNGIPSKEGQHIYTYSNTYSGYSILKTIEYAIPNNAALEFDYYSKPWGTDLDYIEVYAVDEYNTQFLLYTTNVYSRWETVECSLSQFAGQNIKVWFKCIFHYGYGVAVDNFKITGEVTSEVETQIVWSDGVVKQGPNTFIGGDTENPTAWNVDVNWSTGSVPADGADVIINADAVITSEVNVASITINKGDSYPYNTLTVADKGILTVTGTISQQSDYLLVLEEGGQIFQNNNNVTARFRMSIDNPSDWSDETNKDGWQFISMPMTGVDFYGFASTWNSSTAQPTCDYDLYKYDGSQEKEWQNFRDGGFEEDTFKSGTGYLASRKEVSTVSLSGTLNVETPFVFSGYDQIIYNEEKDLANFRLFGNPFTYDIYMSDFDLDLYNDGENDFVSGYAVVNNSGSYDYRTIEPIKVGEGFFVKALTTTAIAYAPNSKRSEDKSFNSLNVIATSNAGKDNVVINLGGEKAGFDKLQNFNDAIATVYVAEDGKNYGIYNCDADVQEIELNFNANQMGNYTISIQPNGKFQTVTLVDRFTGIETNMLLEDYSFTAMSNENNNRFIVKLAVSDQQSAVSDNFVYQSGEDLIIDAEGTVQIIDVMGRVLLSDEVESTNNRINVSGFQNGTYMVRVINGSEVKVEKVVIY